MSKRKQARVRRIVSPALQRATPQRDEEAERANVQRATIPPTPQQVQRLAAGAPALLGTTMRRLQQTYGNRRVAGLLHRAVTAEDEERAQRAVEDEQEEPVRRAVTDKDEERAQRAVEDEQEEPVRRAVTDEEEERAQRAVEDEQEEPVRRAVTDKDEAIQRAPVGLAGGPVAPAVERAIAGARGGGQALDSGVRAQMEGAFDVNFGGVRVHTGHSADQLNRQLSARAFTTGSDIFFRQGAYRPGDTSGRELLAHELTHVVQQGGGVQAKLDVDAADDEHEREAEAAARAVVRRRPEEEGKEQQYQSLDLPQDEFTKAILTNQRPLKLSLYDMESSEKHTRFFKYQADMLAQTIDAVRIPITCPRRRSSLKLEVGATGFAKKDILPILQRATKCTERKIAEFHLFGHLHSGMDFGDANQYAKYLESQVKIVFHGCSVMDFTGGLTALLKAVGSKAEVYAHPNPDDAGRPYEFRRATLPAGGKKLQIESVKQVTALLPKAYVVRWASDQPTARLYSLLKKSEPDIQDDMKEAIIEVLRKRFENEVRNWSSQKLVASRERYGLYEWQKEIIAHEYDGLVSLKDEVQYWRTLVLEQHLKNMQLFSKAGREIIAEELGRRKKLKRDVTQWSEAKLKQNLASPIHWVDEIITAELQRRRRKP